MIFPSKYSLLATTTRICVHISRVWCLTLHSPVAMPMVPSGQWSPVVSSGPGVICSTFIAPSSDTQPAPLHTTTQGYHGHIGIG